MFGLYCVLLQFLLFTKVLSVDYCEFCDGHHTMCIYNGPSQNCREYKLTPLTIQDRNKIVDVHNTLRSDVALGKAQGKGEQFLPTASNMREIKWDNELESIAERWALQCIPYEQTDQHDECRFVERFEVGQNIHTIFSVTPPLVTYTTIIFKWHEEIREFNVTEFLNEQKLKQNAKNSSVSHFTQMMYSYLEYIGCAEILFTAKVKLMNASSIKLGYIKRFICNYGPTKEMDEELYIPGRPCTDCPVGWTCKKGLCSDPIFADALDNIKTINNTKSIVNNCTKIDFNFCIWRVDCGSTPYATRMRNIGRVKCWNRYNAFIKRKLSQNPINKISNRKDEKVDPISTHVLGVWKGGSCRCDRVSRSNAIIISKINIFYLILFCNYNIVYTFFGNY